MAKITSKDIFADKVLKPLRDEADATEAKIVSLNDSLVKLMESQTKIAKSTKSNAAGFKALADAEVKSKNALTEKEKLDKRLLVLQERKNQITNLQRKREAELRVELTRRNKVARDEAKIANQNFTAFEKLNQKIKQLSDSYRNIIAVEGKETIQARKLRMEVTRLKEVRDQANVSLGNHQAFVGKYQNALKGLTATLGKLGLAFGIFNLIRDVRGIGQEARGVEFAFDALGSRGAEAFERIKNSTRGLVSDLDIQRSLVSFDNFNISLEETDTLMEFLAVRATQTGTSIDKLKDSLIEGLSKESKLRIDNLGISALELNEELKKTPNFVQAVANIAGRELEEAGDILDKAANGQDRWNASLENFKLQLSKEIAPVFDKTFGLGAGILKFFGDNLGIIFDTVKVGLRYWIAWTLQTKLLGKEIGSLGIADFAKRISNFFTVLLPSFIKGMKGATFSVKSFGAALNRVPFVQILSIVTALVPLFWDWGKSLFNASDATDDLAEHQERLDNITDKTNEKLKTERAELTRLFDELKKTKKGTDERKEALDNINSIYGTTLKNLSDEKEFVKQLNDAYKDLVSSMESKIRQQLVEEELTKLITRRIELEDQLELATKLQKAEEKRLSTFQDFDAASAAQKFSPTKGLALELDSINAQIELLEEGFDKVGKKQSFLGGDEKKGKTAEQIKLDRLKKFRDEQNKLLKEMENDLISQGLDRQFIDEQLTKKRRELYREESQFIIELGFKTNDILIDNENKRLKHSLDNQDEYLDQLEKKRGDIERVPIPGNVFDTPDEDANFFKKIQDDIREATRLVEDFYRRNQELLDESIKQEQNKFDESKKREDELREIAREKGLDASESIKAEREIQKQALEEQRKLEEKKQKIDALLAALQLLQSGDSIANIKTKINDISSFIEGKFYEGTPFTVADALGRTGTRDGHIVAIDDNESVFTGRQTRDLNIGKGKNTTQDIVDFYKASKNYANSGFNYEQKQEVPNKAVLNKLNEIKEALNSKNKDYSKTTFDAITGALNYEQRNGNKVNKTSFPIRRNK